MHDLLAATWGSDAAGWFDVISAGDCVPAKKPAPDIYLHVLRALDPPSGDALALEDSAVGATSALAAGLSVVVTRSRYTRGDRMPVGLLADLEDLARVDLSQLRAWTAGAPRARLAR